MINDTEWDDPDSPESEARQAGWEPPTPLGATQTLPTFPATTLPEWVRDHVMAVAEFAQTPVDLPACVALSALATTAGGRAVVEVRGRWREPTNLFVVAALPPGSRKSAVFAELTQPLLDTEQALVENSAGKIIEAETLRRIAHDEANAAMTRAAKAEAADEQERLRQDAIMQAEAAESITVPARPRLVADDITPEAAASLLAEQGGRLGVLSAEGGIFQILAGRYSSAGPSLEVFLKGHAGDMLRVDRKGRAPEHIPHPALTLGLTVQPDVLRAIADLPGFRGRGLLARILYSLPEDTVGRRKIRVDLPPEDVAATYASHLGDLVSRLHEWEDPAVLTLTEGARERLLLAAEELEPKLEEHAELGHLRDWAAKLIGATARIAGLLHLAEHRGGISLMVSEEIMVSAVQIGDYFTHHALAAFGEMGADPLIADARYLLAWIKRTWPEEFTRRDAHRGCQRFKRASDLEAPLNLLEEHGYIRRLPDPDQAGRGRPPAPSYEVNPLIRS